MKDISAVSHLSKDIFDLNTISKESQQIKVRVERKKFKKFAIIISGFNSESDAKDVEKYLKKKLACGGTTKNKTVEIQSNNKDKVKELLILKGYQKELIDA
ncbi:MAG: stress response translation initiation inhibitor YciH [archaeon]|jgi:translation initiation factor 1|nr:stress response translation initiation inhibitor YciH [archaeon]MDD2477578.1 stress response translation initiation inhibitor YciH [Candidatus ainarchaeum sp.]MDD3084326.1 stress response translation initiation inhibitor YciH [Candidatus ainarchaeum sp.]MDD4221068.1 stress response translation initiation inhibitor YciH [Candidatus ainarchaeum sp.]MDD4662539.1 stress response translation initiation inhibitor YciH [Candidatus ainarchaeum sp.]